MLNAEQKVPIKKDKEKNKMIFFHSGPFSNASFVCLSSVAPSMQSHIAKLIGHLKGLWLFFIFTRLALLQSSANGVPMH